MATGRGPPHIPNVIGAINALDSGATTGWQHTIASQLVMRGWFFSHPRSDMAYSLRGAQRLRAFRARDDSQTQPRSTVTASTNAKRTNGTAHYPHVSSEHMWGWWIYQDEVLDIPSHLHALSLCQPQPLANCGGRASCAQQFVYAVVPKLYWLSECVARPIDAFSDNVNVSEYVTGDISLYNAWCVCNVPVD